MPPDFALDCDECGFVYDETEHDDAGAAIVAGARRLAGLVRDLDGAVVGQRPDPITWSPLEYACHVRDVLLVQRERVLLARRSATPPHPEPMGREERADHDGYAAQDVPAVTRQLEDAAALLGNVFDRLDPGGWSKTLVYNFPAPFERSLRWVAVHTVHEVRHHLQDVQRQINGPGGSAGSRGSSG